MSKPTSTACPRCGTAIPAAATERLCPACLMSRAIAAPGDETLSEAPEPMPATHPTTEFPREFGEYRLVRLLGSGGMGTVYEAEHLATGRRVALKMLEQQLDSSEMRQRFLREGRLAASVNHPNSLFIFGSEEIAGVPVITMEIAGSGTLKDRLSKRGSLPVAQAVDAILDVISGLEAAYGAGVLHRDIKPSNCFVGPDGSVKVGDFGLSVSTHARDDSCITASGVIMGTPAYASPEQLRGDELDVRGDIYSVGATLFTLLTGQAPFEGRNAVQVVANAVNQKPKPVGELRDDVPPGLDRVVARCLAKEPGGRFADYTALRDALLPFSSREPEPAPMTVRAQAGWIDYLIAFLPPYVALMFLVGAEPLLVRPLVDRTLYSARYYLVLFAFGFFYFTLAEGIWGAGLGKWLKGLRVVRGRNRPPGLARALLRIVIPILCVEGVRMPLMLAWIHDADWTGLQTAGYVIAAIVCGWIPVLLTLRARRDNGFATVWDLASGTRVVVKPKASLRSPIQSLAATTESDEGSDSLGPYGIVDEVVPAKWTVATDPVLRRQVWLLRRSSVEPSVARRDLARPGRPRWLQKVETSEATWDAYEAVKGVPLASQIEPGKRVPWGVLRHWLHDLATELWAATADGTLPGELSLDHVWITVQGQAVLLDEPWPATTTPAQRYPVGDVAGQQRFLNALAGCVESTSLPLHARPVLQNLRDGRFEKLSFLTGNLRGMLDRPADVGRGIRAGSIFMIPVYVWTLVFVGTYEGAHGLYRMVGDSAAAVALTTATAVLMCIALVQLLVLPLRTTASHAIFRLAVVNEDGELAKRSRLLARWAIVWLPLFLPILLVGFWPGWGTVTRLVLSAVLLALWIGAAIYAVVHPGRGLHDRLAHTWVVRQ